MEALRRQAELGGGEKRIAQPHARARLPEDDERRAQAQHDAGESRRRAAYGDPCLCGGKKNGRGAWAPHPFPPTTVGRVLDAQES